MPLYLKTRHPAFFFSVYLLGLYLPSTTPSIQPGLGELSPRCQVAGPLPLGDLVPAGGGTGSRMASSGGPHTASGPGPWVQPLHGHLQGHCLGTAAQVTAGSQQGGGPAHAGMQGYRAAHTIRSWRTPSLILGMLK